MDDKRKRRVTWQHLVSLPQKFSYEVDAPLDVVTQRLAEMEQEARFFHPHQEVSILPMQDRYVFRVRRRRHGTLTTSAEGQIWQDEMGCAQIEGETRINGWSWIVPLVLMSFFGVVISVVSMPAASRYILLIPFFISMLIGFSMSFVSYRRDRQHLINAIDEAIASIKTGQTDAKQKRASRLALEDSDISNDAQEIIPDANAQRLNDGR